MKPNVGIKEWEIEDYLDSYNCFLNGFRDDGTTSILGAYGTVISYTNLKDAVLKSTFSKDDWLLAAKYWKDNGYLSPTFTLLAIWVEKLIIEKFG